ncbi:hypothetical protein ABT072_00315 [Streptomyces sp. NPDC002589]|uniref:hypothetical protein n=1 Tax=Streptomyces sp. NPDC002589 TaxID=3154420 RepID=UPI00331F9C41
MLGPGVLAVLPPAGVTLRVLTRAEIPAAVPLTAPRVVHRTELVHGGSPRGAAAEVVRGAGPGGLTAAL